MIDVENADDSLIDRGKWRDIVVAAMDFNDL